MPELGHFAFPAYCNNAVLRSTAHTCAGQNALDFEIYSKSMLLALSLLLVQACFGGLVPVTAYD